ncbi:MAG: arylsulfatase, partial [Acidimicrobiales bacterium]
DMEDMDFDRARIDLAGGPQALVHYPRGWAMASNTPFRLYKINTHMGGHSVPCILHWPRGQTDPGRRDQWAHVTDVLPTLCELAGVARPAERGGITLQPLNGTSLTPVLADATVGHDRGPQYLEMAGHRGYYDGDWEVVTRHLPLTDFGDHEWELYNLADDRTETTDRAAEQPERVADMAAGWEAMARANQVYPLDEGSRLRYVVRPPYEEPLTRPVRIVAGTHTLERYRSQQLIQWRSFVVDVELRFATGDRGVLFSHGDQGGGYAVYVDDGDELVFVHNGYGAMAELRCGPVPDGATSIRLAVGAPGSWQWDVEVTVDSDPVGRIEGLPMLGAMAPFEGINVGIDRRSPVSWALSERHGTFAFSGQLVAVSYTPGEPAPDAGTRFIDLLREIGMRYE